MRDTPPPGTVRIVIKIVIVSSLSVYINKLMMLININKFRCGTYKVTRLKEKVELSWLRYDLIV